MESTFTTEMQGFTVTISIKPASSNLISKSLTEENGRLEDAVRWLETSLPLESEDVFEGGTRAGFSRRLLVKAGKKLNVTKHPEGRGKNRCWLWELPE